MFHKLTTFQIYVLTSHSQYKLPTKQYADKNIFTKLSASVLY